MAANACVKVCEQELRAPQNYNVEQQQQIPGFNSLAAAQQLPLSFIHAIHNC